MESAYDVSDEVVRTVARICGVAIGLIVVMVLFNMLFGIDYLDMFRSLVRETFVASVSRF